MSRCNGCGKKLPYDDDAGIDKCDECGRKELLGRRGLLSAREQRGI